MSTTLSQALGRLIAETDLTAIPAVVVERAKVSLLHDGGVTPEGLDRVTDAAVLASAQCVAVRPDPSMAERLCGVHVRLRDGRDLHAMIDRPVGQPISTNWPASPAPWRRKWAPPRRLSIA